MNESHEKGRDPNKNINRLKSDQWTYHPTEVPAYTFTHSHIHTFTNTQMHKQNTQHNDYKHRTHDLSIFVSSKLLPISYDIFISDWFLWASFYVIFLCQKQQRNDHFFIVTDRACLNELISNTIIVSSFVALILFVYFFSFFWIICNLDGKILSIFSKSFPIK